MKYDPLIYGKSDLERIVSIEVRDETTELFIENEDGSVSVEVKPNKYWILANERLSRDWIRLKGDLHYCWGRQIPTREEFLKYRQYLKNKDIYSIFDAKESCMIKDGYTYYKGMKHDEVSCLSFDIETTSLDHGPDAKVLIISNTFRKKGVVTRRLFSYSDYETEGDMLVDWSNWVREIDPSIIMGHNIFSYDLPYLNFCANRAEVELCLGRDGSPLVFNHYESLFRIDGSRSQAYKKARVYGREMVDTMFLSIRYDIGRKYESYRLKYIINYEGLEVKDRVFYDADQIRYKYKDPVEWEKIKQYALHDADDSLALYDLMSPPYFYLTQSIPKSYQLVLESASGSQINSVMCRAYLQDAHSLPKATHNAEFEGAISFGNPGIYKNCFKQDVASLYPSIMIEHEVCDEKKDPNRYFLTLVKSFTEKRLHHKKLAKTSKYDDDLQNAYKIFVNSSYGFLGASGLNFNMPEGAAFVTRTGREVLQKAMDWATSKGFTLVNGDTDSIMFTKSDQSFMTEEYRKELLDELNSLFPKQIRFEDDGFYKKVIIVKAKNYILWDGIKLKYKGSAIKASTKEPALKEFIKAIIDAILEDNTEYGSIYNNYVLEALDVKDMSRWCSRKTITEKVLNGTRTNETKVKDAVEDTEYTEGDRVHMFFKPDGTLSLLEHFDGIYDKTKLLEKLFKTSQVFDTIIPKGTFVNWKLKKNQKILAEKGYTL